MRREYLYLLRVRLTIILTLSYFLITFKRQLADVIHAQNPIDIWPKTSIFLCDLLFLFDDQPKCGE